MAENGTSFQAEGMMAGAKGLADLAEPLLGDLRTASALSPLSLSHGMGHGSGG